MKPPANAAPRLNDLVFTPEIAVEIHGDLVREVVRMLSAGVVHGDLSEFNILLGDDGPVIIDLPQAVDAAGNNHAQRMLVRDVDNLRRFFGRFAPALLATDYGKEIWALYVSGELSPEVELTGRFEREERAVDLESVMLEIDAGPGLAKGAEGMDIAFVRPIPADELKRKGAVGRSPRRQLPLEELREPALVGADE